MVKGLNGTWRTKPSRAESLLRAKDMCDMKLDRWGGSCAEAGERESETILSESD